MCQGMFLCKQVHIKSCKVLGWVVSYLGKGCVVYVKGGGRVDPVPLS